MNPAQVIKKAKETKGTKEKVKLFKNNMSKEMKFILEHACSPFITFGIKQYEFLDPIETGEWYFEVNFKYIVRLCKMLSNRQITGDSAAEAIAETSKHLNPEQQFVLDKILQKDLDCGIGAKTVEKICPGLIPSFDVQLANKDQSKIKFPCYAEVKANGKRVIAIANIDTVQYFSRQGKELYNFHCFDKELLGIAAGIKMVFDGEVSGNTGNHKKDFKISQSVPKKPDPNYDDSVLRYKVWDMMTTWSWNNQKCSETQRERSNSLKDAIFSYWETMNIDPKVVWSRPKIIKNKKKLLEYFNKMVKRGEEGLVVKDPEGKYEFKRSNTWIKMKVGKDVDLPIVDVVEGKKSWEKTLAAVVVEYKGNRVHCGVKGFTRKSLKKLWKKRKELIGQTAEIVYMNECENDKGEKSLYLPKFTRIRDDK